MNADFIVAIIMRALVNINALTKRVDDLEKRLAAMEKEHGGGD